MSKKPERRPDTVNSVEPLIRFSVVVKSAWWRKHVVMLHFRGQEPVRFCSFWSWYTADGLAYELNGIVRRNRERALLARIR